MSNQEIIRRKQFCQIVKEIHKGYRDAHAKKIGKLGSRLEL